MTDVERKVRESAQDERFDTPESVEVPPDEEVFSADVEEGAIPQQEEYQEEQQQMQEPRVQVGLHPLGGIGVSVIGPTGNSEGAQVSIDEAWRIVGHLSALTGMLVGSAYAQHAMEAEQAVQQMQQSQSKGGVVLPPRR